MTQAPLAFGPFVVDPARGLLMRNGERLSVGHRAIDLPVALVEAGGDVMPKAALPSRVWPGTTVEEAI